MSIRNSPPPYNTNIPVVTSGGGTAAAYKDPNSPESLMKKTATMSAQAAVDSTYDIKEGFVSYNKPIILTSIIFFVLWLDIKYRPKKTGIYYDIFRFIFFGVLIVNLRSTW